MWLYTLIVAIFTIAFYEFIKPNFEDLAVAWFGLTVQTLWVILFIAIGQYWLIIVPVYYIWRNQLSILNEEYKWW